MIGSVVDRAHVFIPEAHPGWPQSYRQPAGDEHGQLSAVQHPRAVRGSDRCRRPSTSIPFRLCRSDLDHLLLDSRRESAAGRHGGDCDRLGSPIYPALGSSGQIPDVPRRRQVERSRARKFASLRRATRLSSGWRATSIRTSTRTGICSSTYAVHDHPGTIPTLSRNISRRRFFRTRSSAKPLILSCDSSR